MDFNRQADRRKEERARHSGEIEISFDDPTPVTVKADFIEVSTRGFRAAHDAPGLTAGLVVHYASPNSSGRARVIWTQVLDGRCVSGFLILTSVLC